METFEAILLILAGALVIRAVSERLALPSPVTLAVGGAAVALVPGMPDIDVDPGLVLALFVAPILLDAAYDTSVRDLRRTWLPLAMRRSGVIGDTAFHIVEEKLDWSEAAAVRRSSHS